ncbi:MAG: altronate dehydratase family protein [Bacteroidales bacterium]|jgi:altronate hydrolase
MIKYVIINSDDNVAVAIETLNAGDVVAIKGDIINIVSNVPAGHKFALNDIKNGSHIIKYGYSIGHARSNIYKGSLVNGFNTETNLGELLEYSYRPIPEIISSTTEKREFMGYLRADGRVGIRNEIWIVPTVGCVNGVAGKLAAMLNKENEDTSIDSFFSVTHNHGCSQLGDDLENTRKILRNLVKHPNAGGVLVIGLGCENNQLDSFQKFIGEYDSSRIKFMECQRVPGDELIEGMNLLREICKVVKNDRREKLPLSKLNVGLKCGGSDGFSGITANPLLGLFSDFLVSQGGTSVLTEVPEMFGAETILMNRCQDIATFNKTVSLINDFKKYFIDNGQSVYENPSPGNIAGGISTLEEKSLGCTQKSGKSKVRDVLSYGDVLKVNGLNLLSAPGNDIVASTALAAAGCQLILFTTGRGTPLGSCVPTIKISSNTSLFIKKPNWIDFNAGGIVEGEEISVTCKKLIDMVIDVASGRRVKNEDNEFRDIAIFKTGVTL